MIDFEKFVKFSRGGPRYTSYPTAVDFVPMSGDEYAAALESAPADLPLSLYVHLPFCRSACYFCGCNVIYTSKTDKKPPYIAYLGKELALLRRHIDPARAVRQIHFGGGTPTFFSADELEKVIFLLKEAFPNIAQDAEISCEVDPRYFSPEQMGVLRAGGFNRLSFGVQDFAPKVQQAIHRIQSVELVTDAVKLARSAGIDSINFDLIYGLPNQSVESFAATLREVVKLSPERLAIFNYAHVPWVKKTMRKIDESALPAPKEKLNILKNSIDFLLANDYEMIGMDHFAKKSDALARAKNDGTLRRNFQGYTTGGFTQSVGVGVTSISEGVDFYAQNTKEMAEYEAFLDAGKLPTIRGVALSDEDILRKDIIMGLMNNLRLDFGAVNEKFGIDFKSKFARELASLGELEEAGLVSVGEDGITTSQTGGMLIRNIAMAFDPYLVRHNAGNTFSKTI